MDSVTGSEHPSTVTSIAPQPNHTVLIALPFSKIPFSLHDGALSSPPSLAEIGTVMAKVGARANAAQFIRSDEGNKRHGATSLIFGLVTGNHEQEMNDLAGKVMAAVDGLHDEFLEERVVVRNPETPGTSSLKRSRELTDTVFLDDGIGAEFHVASGQVNFSDHGENLDKSFNILTSNGWFFHQVADVADFASRKARLVCYKRENAAEMPQL